MADQLPQIIVAQLGARMHYAVPAILHRAKRLAHFYTGAYVGKGSPWHFLYKLATFLPGKWQADAMKRLLGRCEASLPAEKVTAYNFLDLQYIRALHRGPNLAARERIHLAYGRRFCEQVLQNKFAGAAAVYAFQSAALLLFRAINSGITKIYEKSGAPKVIEYQLFSEEYRRWPGWEPPFPELEVWQPRIDLEREECQAADAVVCGSDFVARGLASLGVGGDKIHVVPYGIEVARYASERRCWDGRRPLRVLFAGGVTLRKGPQYLMRALEILNSSQIAGRMVGPVVIQEPYRRLLGNRFELRGQVPRSEMHLHYEWADLFVFPSICEGSATVNYEALAAGLPVITTPNAGSVVRDGVDGFIVPIRDAEAIAERIDKFLQDPELLQAMSQNARERVQDFSWERYGERLVKVIDGLIKKS